MPPAKPRRTASPGTARRACRERCAAWSTRPRSSARSRGRNWCSPRWTWRRKGFALSYAQANGLTNAAPRARPVSRNRSAFSCATASSTSRATLFVQADLGRTLERIAHLGAKDFYEGETARLLAEDMQEHGGLITLQDLKDYAAIERKPLTGKYKGYDIITSPPPSSGGVGILQMLGVLEGTGYEKAGAGSASVVHYMTEAMRRYFADRARAPGRSGFREGAAQRPCSTRPTSAGCARPSIRNAPRRQSRGARGGAHRARIQRDHALHGGRRRGQHRARSPTP